jgi:RNA polymerase sigma-70 factor (family 1)
MSIGVTPHSAAIFKLNMSEQGTFDHIFRLYHASLCFYAQRTTGSKNDAEDVVEEVFMQCWTSAQVFDSEDHARYFLYRAVRNAALNKFKATQRLLHKHSMAGQQYDDSQESHLERLIRSEVMREVYQEIERLPAQERKVILLSLQEGKKIQDIADELSLSLQTVKNCKSRAISRLRLKLSGEAFLLLNAMLFFVLQRKA